MNIQFPVHSGALFLEHNAHKNSYQSIIEWIEDDKENGQEFYAWKNEEQKQRAIDANEVWTLQWYPETPVGFHAVAAPTLEELLEFANETK